MELLPSHLSELVQCHVHAHDLCLAGVSLLWASKCWRLTARREWEGANGFIVFCILFHNCEMDFQLTFSVLLYIIPQNPFYFSNIRTNAREFTVKTKTPLLTHWVMPRYCCTYYIIYTKNPTISKQKQVSSKNSMCLLYEFCALVV